LLIYQENDNIQTIKKNLELFEDLKLQLIKDSLLLVSIKLTKFNQKILVDLIKKNIVKSLFFFVKSKQYF